MDYASIFNQLAQIVTDRVPSLVQGGIAEPLLWTFTGAAAYKFVEKYSRLKQRQALTRSSLGMSAIPVEQVSFIPSGAINPVTGKEFYDQEVWTRLRVNLGKAFDSEVADEILGYLNQAKKFCTMRNPLAFAHLGKVVHPARLAAVQKILTEQWVSLFSSALLKDIVYRSYEGRDAPVESSVIPLLVYEPDAPIKQFRVLLVTRSQINRAQLPDFEDTRFFFKIRDAYSHDPAHEDSYKVKTYHQLERILKENPWIKNTCISIPTGEVREVPLPGASRSSWKDKIVSVFKGGLSGNADPVPA